jgi:hypothetical protein
VPKVQRNLRRDGRPETHQHVVSLSRLGIHWGSHAKQTGIARVSREFYREDGLSSCLQTAPMDRNGLIKSNSMAIDLR